MAKKQKCLNDLFGGYCSSTPEIAETKDVGSKEAGHWTISTCKLNPKNCGKYKKFSEVVKPAEGLGPARIIKVGEKTAAKCGSGKKGKGKTIQGTLFE